MTASEAVSTSLRVVTAPSTSQDESKSRRLAYLNALVKMWQKCDPNSDDGLRLHEVMLWYVFIIKQHRIQYFEILYYFITVFVFHLFTNRQKFEPQPSEQCGI